MKHPLCLLRLHKYDVVSSEDGSSRFLRCRRCGREDTRDSAHWLTGLDGGG